MTKKATFYAEAISYVKITVDVPDNATEEDLFAIGEALDGDAYEEYGTDWARGAVEVSEPEPEPQQTPRHIYLQDPDTNEDTDQIIMTLFDATPEHAEQVLTATTEGGDGRSKFYFARLNNGDLMLVCYPQGDTYMEVTDSYN